jgi:hypothetical protein
MRSGIGPGGITGSTSGGAVTSVATRTGDVVLTEADIASLVADLAAKLVKASNLSDLANAGTARTNLGLGTAAVSATTDFLQTTNNLSDVTAATARTNLGLGTAATTAATAYAPSTGIAESAVTDLTTDLAAKAPLSSPALTGTPTVPTATPATNTTQAASTAYADAIAALKANIASPTLTGTPAAPTAAQGTNTTQIATTAMVHSEAVLLAPLASPTFTGTVTLPNSTVTNAQLAGSITAAKISASLDQFTAPAADVSANSHKITSLTSGSAPTDATAFGQNQIAYDLAQRGILAQNFAPTSSSTAIAVSQSLYVMKIWLPYTISVTSILVGITTAGATLTSGQNIATLYAQDGTKKGDTADQSAVWTTGNGYVMAVSGGPYTMTGGAGAYCWVSILSNGTTPATFASGGNRVVVNLASTGELTGANMIIARNGTTVTASPSPLVPGSNVVTGSQSIWIGLA